IMFLPTFIEYAFVMLAENLTMVSMTVTLYCIWKWTRTNRWWYGLIAVLSIIVELVTRPSNQFDGIMYAMMLVFIVWFVPGMRDQWRSYTRKAVILAVGPMIYLMGVSAYYYQETGIFGQSSLSGIAFLTRMWRVY